MEYLTRRSALALSLAAATLALRPGGASAAPDYYPSDYDKIIEASRAENGVLVYSNIGEMNWRPILEAFNKVYPWINVRTLDLGSSEVFERYYAEQAAGKSEVDIVMSHNGATWLDFINKGNVAPFVSAEDSKLPDWTKPAPGVYTISADPYLVAYNKLLLPEDQWPKSMADIVQLVKDHPGEFDKKLATGIPMNTAGSQSQAGHYINKVGLDKVLEIDSTLGPLSDLYRSAGPIMEKITAGEYLIGYTLSAIQLFPLLADPAREAVLGFTFPSDGMVMLTRHLALASTNKSPNSAKLLLDFVLSQEGQVAVSQGGLMPSRSDIELPDGPLGWTADKVAAQIGADNVIYTTFDPKLMVPSDEVIAKVKAAFGLKS